MENLQKFYINGQWAAPISTATLPVLNPAMNEQIGTVSMGNSHDVDKAVASAKAAFASYSQTSKADRLVLLKQLKEESKKRFEDMAQAMRMEMGAPITMARDAQADAALGHLQGFIESLEELHERIDLPNGDVMLREAIGVCGLITPWNWPINQIALKVIPALATGCTCVLKPSEHTPVSAMIYAEIIHSAGYPAGVFNLVNGDGPTVGSCLARHQDIQMMSFTGSTRAGKAVTHDAAETVKRVTLELGGKSPNIIFADADFDKSVSMAARAAFTNQGQICLCGSRLFIQEEIYDKFRDALVAKTAKLKVGDPKDDSSNLGAVVSKDHMQKILAKIELAKTLGGKILIGGKREILEGELRNGYYVQPTIIEGLSSDCDINQEEIFGPVVSLIPFKTEEEVVEMANSTKYGLSASIFTENISKGHRIAAKIDSGVVWINTWLLRDLRIPFGGMKHSGVGREGGFKSLEFFTEPKNVCVKI